MKITSFVVLLAAASIFFGLSSKAAAETVITKEDAAVLRPLITTLRKSPKVALGFGIGNVGYVQRSLDAQASILVDSLSERLGASDSLVGLVREISNCEVKSVLAPGEYDESVRATNCVSPIFKALKTSFDDRVAK